MRIESLRLCVTDQDLSDVIRKHVPEDAPVKDLAARLTAEGIVLGGKYRKLGLWWSFEATVRVLARGPTLRVELTRLKAAGPVGPMLRSKVMRALGERLSGLPGVEGEEDGIACDTCRLLAQYGLAFEPQTLQIAARPGQLVLDLSGSLTW